MTKRYRSFAMTNEHCRPVGLHLAALLLCILMPGVSQADANAGPKAAVLAANSAGAPVKPKELRMWMNVGERRFAVTLADTDAARAFAAKLPLTLDMSDLNGNEKKIDLSTDLPAKPSRPGTIRNGDIMLYGTNTVVVFYLTFDSPYSYTRLGRVEDPSGLAQALGKRDVQVTFSPQ
jgi:hypothetical protein